MKYILISLFIVLNIFAQEEVKNDNNIVKTSELELFLFKIGFQSLLTDVDSTKDKVALNEDELKKLNSKVEVIMNEIYKDKRVLKADSSSVVVQNSISNKEIENLKKEIALLKTQMLELQKIKANEVENAPIKKEKVVNKDISIKDKTLIGIVREEELYVREKASSESNILSILKQGTRVEIDSCSKHGWCKLKDEKKYVAKFLLDF